MIWSWRWSAFMVLCFLYRTNSIPLSSTASTIIVTAGQPSSTTPDTVSVEASSTTSDANNDVSSATVTEATQEWPSTSDPKADIRYKPKITSMHVDSNVTLRYAKTLVTSKVSNPDTKANEVTFSVVIPETAFITAFSMEIDGKVYDAYVKEKDEAKKEYQTAVNSGISAAHVAVKARDSNHFTVSVNVEPQKKAIFRLYYEELLSRRLGLYNLVMNLSPGQLVEDFAVDVDIQETSPIKAVYVPSLRTGNEVDADPSDEPNQYAQKTISEDKLNAKVHFAPTKAQQLELMEMFKDREKPTPQPVYYYNSIDRPANPSNDEEGVKGQFVVQYDVDRETKSEVMINDGYFVHFFAPVDLKPLNKHVIFVLDVSGSMVGRKISQLKDAMTSILQNLNPGDYFSIMDFHYSVKVYNLEDPSKNAIFKTTGVDYPWDDDADVQSSQTAPPPYPATKENIDKAKAIIKGLEARGGTNIYDALTTALKVANDGIQMSQMLPEATEENRLPEPMVIFLTDGDPTVGETNTDKILSTVKEMNPKSVAIFSLAFGEDADRGFLRRVALQNSGFLRHIYEAADAAQQLRHFYRLVASPLLANVTFTYPKDQIEEKTVTKKKFDYYFLGSELVVAGKVAEGKKKVDLPDMKLHANSYTGPIDFIPIAPPEEKRKNYWPLERMWAYISIKQLLDEKDEMGGKAEDLKDPDSPASKALELALKYSFVTPLTSLVVVKPNSTAAVDAEAVDASGADNGFALPLTAGGGPAGFSAFQYTTPMPHFRPFAHAALAMPMGGMAMRSSMMAPVYHRQFAAASSSSSSAVGISALHQKFRKRPAMSQSYSPAVGQPQSALQARPQYPNSYLSTFLDSAVEESDSVLTDTVEQSKLAVDNDANKKYLTTTTFPVRRLSSAAYGPPGPPLLVPAQPMFEKDSISEPEESFDSAPHPTTPLIIPPIRTTAIPKVTTPIPKVTTPQGNETKTLTPEERMKLYRLEAYPWLIQYLDAKDDAFSIPLPSKSTLKYNLKRKDDTYPDSEDSPCANSIGGGLGVCQDLISCKDLDKGFKDLNTYLNYFCDANGYAGICCKVETP